MGVFASPCWTFKRKEVSLATACKIPKGIIGSTGWGKENKKKINWRKSQTSFNSKIKTSAERTLWQKKTQQRVESTSTSAATYRGNSRENPCSCYIQMSDLKLADLIWTRYNKQFILPALRYTIYPGFSFGFQTPTGITFITWDQQSPSEIPHTLNKKSGSSLITRQFSKKLAHLNEKVNMSFIHCRSMFKRSNLNRHFRKAQLKTTFKLILTAVKLQY